MKLKHILNTDWLAVNELVLAGDASGLPGTLFPSKPQPTGKRGDYPTHDVPRSACCLAWERTHGALAADHPESG